MRRFVKNASSLVSQPGAARAVGQEYSASDSAAQTRFNNDRQNAAASTLNASLGTSNAIGPQVSRPAPTGVQTPAPAPAQVSQPFVTRPAQAVQALRGPMTADVSKLMPAPEPQFNQESFDNNYKLEALVRSPQFQASVVKTQLQEYFRNRNNPGPGNEQDPAIYAENVLGNMKG